MENMVQGARLKAKWGPFSNLEHLGLAQLLQRFYSLIKIEARIEPINWEWIERHLVYPNTRKGYSWEDEDWWLLLYSNPGYTPEVMNVWFATSFHFGAPFRALPDWLIEPLDKMYHELRRTKERDKRFQIYKKANEYIASQALSVYHGSDDPLWRQQRSEFCTSDKPVPLPGLLIRD